MAGRNFDKVIKEFVKEPCNINSSDVEAVEQYVDAGFKSGLTPKFEKTTERDALLKLYMNAARLNISSADFADGLSKAGVKNGIQISEAYEGLRKMLFSLLGSVEPRYPALVEVNYKLSGLAETDQFKRIRRPVGELSFNTARFGQNGLDETVVHCDEGNLLLMQSRLAEVLAKLEELSTFPESS